MIRHVPVNSTAWLATALSVFSPALVSRSDIFQWEYINPANPSLGKQQSTTLALDGAGVDAQPGAELSNRYLAMAYLIGMDLSGATAFGYADLTDADLSHANLTSVNFAGDFDDLGSGIYPIYLNGANLAGANLTTANFYLVELAGANLMGVNASSAQFIYATLTGANLRHASLTNAILESVCLKDADLSHADIANAWFSDASLDDANLTGADARGALALNLPPAANTTNLIQPDGHLAGLDLTGGELLVIRDYDGNPAASIGPLPIVIDEHLTMDAGSTLRLEFDPELWDSTICFAPGIPVMLSGKLELAFATEVDIAAQIGRTIDLFDWGGVAPTGVFNVTSPYTWDLSHLYTTGEVILVSPGIVTGDFNGDGLVDGGDLASWRTGFGTTSNARNSQGDADGDQDVDGADLLAWQRSLGRSAARDSVIGLTAAVPEPATLLLLLLCIALGLPCHFKKILRRTPDRNPHLATR